MEKMYMVVSYGVSKKTGNPYSMAQRMTIGISKIKDAKGSTIENPYGYLNEKDTYYLDDIRNIGDIIKIELKEVN